MPHSLSAVSIIIPTFREALNIKPLTERIFAAVSEAGYEAELIFVDDNSQDGTDAVVEALRSAHAVRLVVRRNERGLSSAVLAGFREARHDCLVVLDADLQHPPEMIPALVRRLEEGDADFAIATRYAGSGAIAEDWPVLRRLGSRIATLLARPLAPLSDPMSGFFALRRETWEKADRLDPIGYKIALELYVKGRCRRPAEVPIRFETRAAGESKASLRVQLSYLQHLAKLYRFRYPVITWSLIVVALAGLSAAVLILARWTLARPPT